MKYFIFIAALFLTTSLFAQRNFIEAADRDFEDMKYAVAVDKYKKAYSKTKDRDEKNRIRFQMAECYRMMNNAKRAEVYYKSLYRHGVLQKESHRIALLWGNDEDQYEVR